MFEHQCRQLVDCLMEQPLVPLARKYHQRQNDACYRQQNGQKHIAFIVKACDGHEQNQMRQIHRHRVNTQFLKQAAGTWNCLKYQPSCHTGHDQHGKDKY